MRRHVPTWFSTSLTVAVLLPLTACGGQAQAVRDGDRYAERVNAAQERFERDLARLRTTVSGAEDRADVQRATRRLSLRINAVERELRAIHPPAVVAEAHGQLASAFARWRVPVDAFLRALRRRDLGATLRAKTEFSSETAAVETRVNDARRKINEGLRRLSD